MPEGTPDAPPPPVLPILRPRTGIAWAVIAVVFLAVQAMRLLPDQDPEGATKIVLEVMRQQVQQQYGVSDVVKGFKIGALEESRLAALDGFKEGPVPQRQRFAVVAGDIEGPAAARERLEETERILAEKGIPLEGTEKEVQALLHRLYAGDARPHDPSVLAAAEQATLRRELDWFGDLALAPEGSPGRGAVLAPARAMTTRQLVLMAALLVLLGVGLAAAVLHWVLAANGSVRFLLRPGAAPHGVYAETFAAWILLFIGLQVGAGLLFALLAPGSGILLPGAVSFLGSLVALRWPVYRGVPWSRVRADVGLFLSPTPVRDVLAGVACWAMAVPVMAAALVVSVILMAVQQSMAGPPDPLAPPAMPSHPAMGEVGNGTGWIGILLLAAVVAPVVEETFFRGVLYRHLRDATGLLQRGGSVIV